MEDASVQPTFSTRLSSPWLFPARILWLAGTLIALGLFLAGLPLRAEEIRKIYQGSIQATLVQNQTGQIFLTPWSGSAAAQAGVLQGDVLLAVDEIRLTSVDQGSALLGGQIGSPVAILVKTGDFPARVLTVTRESEEGGFLLMYGLSSQFAVTLIVAAEVLLAVLCMTLAGLIFWFRPDDWMALYSALMLVVVITGLSLPVVALANEIHTGSYPYWMDIWLAFGFSLLILFFYLFPAGQLASRLTSILAVVLVLWLALGVFNRPLLPWYMPRLSYITVGLAWLVTGVASLSYRYRRSSSFQRQQIRWIVWGAGANAVGLILQIFPLLFSPEASSRVLYDFLLFPLGQLFKACLPLSIAFAILRYRLWNIDFILNRMLVYGSLSVLTMLGYLGTIFVLHVLFIGLSNPVISFVATGIVAILFEPLRRRLQRGVNRWMYGERDDPYAVLSRLVGALEHTLSANEVLPLLAETIGHSLKIPYVAIWLDQDGKEKLAAASGMKTIDVVSFPLIYQGETIGRLDVGPRAPMEPFSEADRRLIENVANQAGAAAQTVRLNAELIRSRTQIVNEREDERLRIRRDLHDELGPMLASQGLKLAAARRVIRTKPEKAESLVDDVIKQSQKTVADIRRLVHGLRPPALDQLGLVEAIRDMARSHSNGLAMEVSILAGGLPRLPAAVEVNAYRIILEAWNNTLKHAQASCFTVEFQVQQEMLVISIQDDGVGMPKEYRSGIGLRSMRARAQEISGDLQIESAIQFGTHITVRLPLSS